LLKAEENKGFTNVHNDNVDKEIYDKTMEIKLIIESIEALEKENKHLEA